MPAVFAIVLIGTGHALAARVQDRGAGSAIAGIASSTGPVAVSVAMPMSPRTPITPDRPTAEP